MANTVYIIMLFVHAIHENDLVLCYLIQLVAYLMLVFQSHDILVFH
jgi:hypothetical protein